MSIRFLTRKHRTLYWFLHKSNSKAVSICDTDSKKNFWLVQHRGLCRVKGKVLTHHADYSLIPMNQLEELVEPEYDPIIVVNEVLDKIKSSTINGSKTYNIESNPTESKPSASTKKVIGKLTIQTYNDVLKKNPEYLSRIIKWLDKKELDNCLHHI